MPTPDPRHTDPPCDLAGLSVLVTRPAEQAEELCKLIEQARGRPIRFPALEILGPVDKQAARRQLLEAGQADMLIFVSANAVQYAFPLLPEQLPLDIDITAVGKASARALSAVGLEPTLVPERMDSEGLLALPAMQDVDGRRIIILRGNAGRELLADTLRARGAEVMQVEVYRRQRPRRVAAARNLIAGWEHLVDVVVATSNDILDNLFALLGEAGTERLRHTPLVVVSQRMAAHAVAQGCEIVYIATSAMDTDVLGTLCEVNDDVA